MNMKRALTLLLAVCMVFTLLAPGVSAVAPGTDHHKAEASSEKEPFTALTKKAEDTASAQQADTEGKQTGHWTASETNVKTDLISAQLPEDIQELRKAAEFYAADEIVAAFIVLEGAPLVEKYASGAAEIAASSTNAMLKTQNALIKTIEKEALGGEKLNVRYQFTYLTNSVTVRVPFADLEKIAKVEGVKSVFVAPVYNVCTETPAKPATAGSGVMTGVPSAWDLGYTGTGMKVAIIDTGLDLDHPSFAADPETNENSLTAADLEPVLSKLNASKLYPGLTAANLYRSAKIPYAFNYVDENLVADHSRDSQGDHGSHVAGIVAANHLDTTEVVGMAPDAQLVIMKVFGAAGGAYTDDIIAALEDALTLGVDVVNMSLGSAGGFTTANPEIDAVYERIASTGTIVAIAAGNEGTSPENNNSGIGKALTTDPDTATISSPATYANATAVASAENAFIMSNYFAVGDSSIAYTDATGLYMTFDSLGFDALEYVMVPGLGEEADYEGLDVEGKIAVVSRGVITFSSKLAIAEANGAAALVVYNNQPGAIGMQMTDDSGELPFGVSGMVPAVSVSQKAGQIMAAAADKTLTISPAAGAVLSDDAGQMSTFSSWGVSPNLELEPDITGVGGNVYSTVDGGKYDTMSGTSMATPQVAGVTALVTEYLKAQYPHLTAVERRALAEKLLMSTADPIISTETSLEASPRQQGSGLVNALAAVTSEAYLTVNGGKPTVSLGDDADRTGVYSFTFEVNNMGTEPKTYTFDSTLLTEDYLEFNGAEYMAEVECLLDGTVSFSASSVTVAPGNSVSVTVTVKLSAEGKAWLNRHYANGGYVEGFIYAVPSDEDGVTLSLPFLGFYGDWTVAPLMDTGFWYEDSFWDDELEPTGKEYYHILWTPLAGNNWVIGGNPYTGLMGQDPEHRNFVVSPNGDGVIDGLDEIYYSNLRNADTITVTYTDAETGEVYSEIVLEKCNKTMYNSNYGQVVPSLHTWYAELYDFTDAEGKPLPSGTTVIMNVDSTLEFDAHEQHNEYSSWSVPITVDTEAPVLVNVDGVSGAEGNTLVLTVADDSAIAAVYLYDATGTHVLAKIADYELDIVDGKATVALDITGLGTEFTVYVCDYGANEGAYTVRYTLDDNLPEVVPGLYGYRVSDNSYDPNDESYYGWVSIDKETAELTQLTHDELEGYALTAAEYAGGYVFGVDAGYHFVVMEPGLWTRRIIRDLDLAVEDLTFDSETQTMYALAHDRSYNSYICSIDLYTGEMETVADLGYFYNGPVNLEWVNGDFYAIYHSENSLYKIDGETFEAEPVLAFEEISTMPTYAQSMTYSAADNTLYWAYYGYSFWGGGATLFAVNMDDLSYTAADFENMSEFVGLVTLEDEAVSAPCDGTDCPSASFTDVNTNAYYHAGVDFVVSNGYMSGTTDTTFSPKKTVTRAMVSTILYSMAGKPAVEGTNEFTDVPEGAYYENAVIWAKEIGITAGVSETEFAPGKAVTRQDLALFLYKYAKMCGMDVTSHFDSLAQFEDLDQVSGYALTAVKWAVAEGILGGTSDTTLSPKATAQRGQLAVMLLKLYSKVLGGFRLTVADSYSQILLQENLTMAAGNVQALSFYALPWNAAAELTWTSSDESVALVEDGVVLGLSEGTALITASCGNVSAECLVTVVEIHGEVYAYNYYSGAASLGDYICFELDNLPGYESLFDSPVDFLSAEYNGHTNKIYGYTETFQLYCLDMNNGTVTAIGAPQNGKQIVDMAYNYSNGMMYASVVDPSTGEWMLCSLNLRNGQLMPVAMDYSMSNVYMTLACDLEGNFYGISSDGMLYSLAVNEDWGEVEPTMIADLGFGGLNYIQSMCYDYNNDQLVWAASLGYSTMVWIDPMTGACLDVGTPTGDHSFELVGLFTIPEEIPALPYVPVDYVEAEPQMSVLLGSSKAITVNMYPANATNQDVVWQSEDETIATVDEFGNVTGVSLGTTALYGTLDDDGEIWELYTEVTVIEAVDELIGYVAADLATYGGDVWAVFNPADTANPELMGFSDYSVRAAEYVNGYIYAYAIDPMDWQSPVFFMTLDGETFDVLDMIPVENCPTVYDMAYDYTRGVMFAVAGFGDTSSDLYVIDMVTGTPIKFMDSDPFLMALAADENGTLYGFASSEEVVDEWGWPIGYGDSFLWAVNPDTKTMEAVGSTGIKNNMMTSATYDYASGKLYWAPLFQMGFGSAPESGLYMVETADASVVYLGIPGQAGMQLTALMLKDQDNLPETVTELSTVILTQESVQAGLGDTIQLSAITIPGSLDGLTITWTSDDEAVATVDETGLVTTVGGGVANITVTASLNGETRSASCKILVFTDADRMIAYSSTMGGWAGINRLDSTDAVLLADEANQTSFVAAAYANGTIYAYDPNGILYAVNAETYERTEVGFCGIDEEHMALGFLVRDMAYDATTGTMYAIGACRFFSEEMGGELEGSNYLYTVNLETGALTEVVELYNYQTFGLAVDGNGTLYGYSSFDDSFSTIDVNTGMMTMIATSQSMSVYGSENLLQPMCYDAATGLIYWLQTGNGSFYTMYALNPNNGEISAVGRVGEVVYDSATWTNYGDSFAALVIK